MPLIMSSPQMGLRACSGNSRRAVVIVGNGESSLMEKGRL